MINEKQSKHQQLANILSPKYVVYDIAGGIGVSKEDFELLNDDDKEYVKNMMLKVGIPVRNVVSCAEKDEEVFLWVKA